MKYRYLLTSFAFCILFASSSMASTAPDMVAGSFTDKPALEIALLKQGAELLVKKENLEALKIFVSAANKYGSPLGYLYAGALVGNTDYINIASESLRYNALADHIFQVHLDFLAEKGLLPPSFVYDVSPAA